ncbi:MAG: hypothetical protein IT385_02240 [Deltaproteobacteria bacterium]|nr:hypothetical protein [Deltaproteobacteria bacterium]
MIRAPLAWAVGLASVTAVSAVSAPIGRALPPEPRLFELPPAEVGKDDWFVNVHPEYRVRLIRLDPLEVNGTVATGVAWGEQRLRIDASLGRRGLGAIHMQIDALDGVLFGDNGEFGRAPEPTSGVGIASRQVNHSGWRVGLLPGADPLAVDSYGPVLRDIEPLQINYLYGEVLLPFGVVRIGRQPLAESGTVSLNDGRSGRNLWGASYYHESVDRLLFGTKISEVFGFISEGATYKVDRALDNGVFLGLVWDYLVEDQVQIGGDDLQGFAAQLDFRWKDPHALGEDWGPIRFTATTTFRWDDRFNTNVFALPLRLQFSIADFQFLGEFSYITGTTRELSAGFAALNNQPVTDQDIKLTTARIAPEYVIADQLTLRLEWAYAAGDDDPRTTTPLTISSWPRDTNLGLLLFEHTLAFQTARSAQVGIENLRQVEADSFPLTEIATDGRVTNVNALFPQIFWDVLPTLRLKAGMLFAWAAADTVDPIQSLLAWDGTAIADDTVNYVGGRPGSYWGTELDLGVELRYEQLFTAVVEAAVLFPGSGLEDENGDAVTSWMLEARFVFHP